MSRLRLGLVALCGALAMGGCSIKPLNDHVLPGGIATGSDGYRVTAEFASVENLVPNSQVLYNNVAIGTVLGITLTGWHARVTVALRTSVPLPANVTMKIGQKSLLGAEYLEVDEPSGRPSGTLRAGTVIPLNRTGHYPETEEVLAATSLLLNDGGLAQLKTITTELDDALGGPAQQRALRSLIGRLGTFVADLNGQRVQLTSLLGALNRLGSTLATERSQVARAIDHLDPGLRLLNTERTKLTDALVSLGRFGTIARDVIQRSGDKLAANLAALRPVLAKLRAAGAALPEALNELGTLPFPLQTVQRAFKGDYANVFLTFDLSVPALLSAFVGGPVSTSTGGGNLAQQAHNPVTAPLTVNPKPAPARSGSTTTAPPATCNLVQKLLRIGGC